MARINGIYAVGQRVALKPGGRRGNVVEVGSSYYKIRFDGSPVDALCQEFEIEAVSLMDQIAEADVIGRRRPP